MPALGTREYWEQRYEEDLAADDVGETWFGEGALRAAVSFLAAHLSPEQAAGPCLVCGCGNGDEILELREELITGPIVGADYSAKALDVARKNLQASLGDAVDEIGLIEVSLTDTVAAQAGLAASVPFASFFDKGTLDAISLIDGDACSHISAYCVTLAALAAPGALLIITSCNFTVPELTAHVEASGHWVHEATMKQRKHFSFGGADGSTEVTVLFRLP
jgi:hypothetical protein